MARTWGFIRIVVAALAVAVLWATIFTSVSPAWGRDEAGGNPVALSGQDNSLEPAVSTSPGKILRDGGPLMYAIIFCSVLLVTFTLERAVSLRRRRVIPKPFVKRFLEQLRDGGLDRQQALDLCLENGSPVAQVFAGAVRKWGRPGVEVEQSVIDAGERATSGLRRYLRIFYAVATVGPLLGLMGTVLGMIQTFNVIAVNANAMARSQDLAGGIAKALLNTAGGLAVAIPASILYAFFVSRIDRLVTEIDGRAQEVVNLISAEELQERKNRPAKTRRGGKELAA
jgi:biopolymer transport protein ExbB